jgi:cytochrome c oxidase assembly protein subunit 15
VAPRIGVPLRDLAELHSSLAVLLIGVAIGLAVALHVVDVPERVRRSSRILVGVIFLQGVVGYTQYFTHLPGAVVEIHELGATVLVIGFVQFYLALTHHAPEALGARLRAVPSPVGAGGLAGAVPGPAPSARVTGGESAAGR